MAGYGRIGVCTHDVMMICAYNRTKSEQQNTNVKSLITGLPEQSYMPIVVSSSKKLATW